MHLDPGSLLPPFLFSREEAEAAVTCREQLSFSCNLSMGALPGKTLVSVLIRM